MQSYGQLGAYKSKQREGETPRETEAQALLSCANKLEAVKQEGADYKLYCEALRHNQRLWTMFQVFVSEPDNPLPQEIKIALIRLGRYVDKVSLGLIAKKDPTTLETLININRQIAAGLGARAREENETNVSSASPSAPVQASQQDTPVQGSITTTA